MESPLRRIRYQLSRSKVRVPLIWLQHRGLRSDDIFVASYPRSGSTWLRFCLLEILAGRPAGFENVNDFIPEVGTHRHALALLPGRGRVIKVHEQHRREYRKGIYLVRDPRDVLLSCYAVSKTLDQVTYASRNGFDGYVLSFLRGKVTKFGSWQDHISGWLGSPTAGEGKLLVIRFEDLKRNTEDGLVRILEFLGLAKDREVIKSAIANNSLTRMRLKEDTARKVGLKVPAQLLINPVKSSPVKGSLLPEESRFVRAGSAGGWRERLTEEQVRLFGHYAGRAMALVGYPLDRPLPVNTSREGSATPETSWR